MTPEDHAAADTPKEAPEEGQPSPGVDATEGVPGGESEARRSRQRQVKILIFGVIIAALVALFWPQRPGNRTAPGGFLVDGAGRPTPLGERLTPVTLVHFWATWCPPCVQEAPVFHRLIHDFMNQPGFSVVMIAVEDKKQQVESFLGGPEGARNVLYDPSWDVAHRFGTDQIPETYLLVDGKVTRKYVGATNWDDPEIRGQIKAAIAQAAK